MSEETTLVNKSETALGTNVKMPAGLDGAGSQDFLMNRIKVWSPMSKVEVEGAKLGDWYEANSAKKLGGSVKFFLLSQKNRTFDTQDGKTKTYKYMLIVEEGKDFPAELVISGSGMRAAKALNSLLLDCSLSDKNPNSFSYLIEGKLAVQESKEGGKFGVPTFCVVRPASAEEFERLSGIHAEMAVTYATAVPGVDTATAYDAKDVPL